MNMKTIKLFLIASAMSSSLFAQIPDAAVDKMTGAAESYTDVLETPSTTKIPWDGYATQWQNGSDRRDSSVFQGTSFSKYFMPQILFDIAYTHAANNPNDNTVVGSTALARDNEVQLNSFNFGGDLMYGNARGRFMLQYGTRSQVVPRNDISPYKGQYSLADVYRYLGECYAGYHFNVLYGINVDMGMFMSYVGLNSYYQNENWEYQASFTSDNTPWFFNGIRTQIFVTKDIKIEPWIINGWQSYAMFNKLPGYGGNITWMPGSNFKLLTNDYFGTDGANGPAIIQGATASDGGPIPGRHRFHSDNSYEARYYNNKQSSGLSQAAFSITADIGDEKGGGVNGFTSSPTGGPAQYFLSYMIYNRMWFDHNHYAWTIGGGWMKNPGLYLVLLPTGQASPLPNPNDNTTTAGAFPFSTPNNQFQGWDMSTNFDFMPNQSLTFRIELVTRHSSVPYFAGPGGVTSLTGYSTTPIAGNPLATPAEAAWRPDLVKSDNRIIFVLLFRI